MSPGDRLSNYTVQQLTYLLQLQLDNSKDKIMFVYEEEFSSSLRDAVQKKNGKKSDIVTLAFDPSPP